ncbi:MAG: hypothetical protein ACRD5L_17385, partial [Bryobacteraceae bacterium]
SGKPTGKVRLRTTYEKSVANASSDSYDPDAEGAEAQYRELEGHSFEFTIDAAGDVTDVKGFEDADGQGGGAEAARAWLRQFASVSAIPGGGVSIGQTWSTEQAVVSAPLAGISWRSRSSYERNEPCQPVNVAGRGEAMAGKTCAVILTKLVLTGPRPDREATPENLKKQGYRSAGTWNGDGDSLSYVSIETGQVVSVTQSSNEQMDFTVGTPDGQRVLHYEGAVHSHTQISLLPPAAPVAPAKPTTPSNR